MRRHEWQLSDEQRENLMNYLSEYPTLKPFYHAKQKHIRYLLPKMLTAKRKLPGFWKLIEQLHESPLKALTKTNEYRSPVNWVEPRANGNPMDRGLKS